MIAYLGLQELKAQLSPTPLKQMETCFKMLMEAPVACEWHKKYIFLNQYGSLGFPETACIESFFVFKLKTNPQLLQNSATLIFFFFSKQGT